MDVESFPPLCSIHGDRMPDVEVIRHRIKVDGRFAREISSSTALADGRVMAPTPIEMRNEIVDGHAYLAWIKARCRNLHITVDGMRRIDEGVSQRSAIDMTSNGAAIGKPFERRKIHLILIRRRGDLNARSDSVILRFLGLYGGMSWRHLFLDVTNGAAAPTVRRSLLFHSTVQFHDRLFMVMAKAPHRRQRLRRLPAYG
jgi:hypothetical protein